MVTQPTRPQLLLSSPRLFQQPDLENPRAEGDGRSDADQCSDMKADVATIGPEATLKARRCRRTNTARSFVAISIARTQHSSVNQVGNARISCRAG